MTSDFKILFRLLIEKGKSKIDIVDQHGFTPLHRSCQESPIPNKNKEGEKIDLTEEQKSQNDEQRKKIVKLLVEKGANIQKREPQGQQTPLHLAAINGYAEVSRYVINI